MVELCEGGISMMKTNKTKSTNTGIYERFWYTNKQDNCIIKPYKLKLFLELHGFGRFQSIKARTETTKLFKKNKILLELHSAISIKTWISNFITNLDEDDYYDLFDEPLESQVDVLTALQVFTASMLGTKVLDNIELYSENLYPDTKHLPMFNDTLDESFIIFSNGVVKITKDKIVFDDIDSLIDKGHVWESAVRTHNIKITDDKSMFEHFFNKTMYRKKKDISNVKDWTDEYELSQSELTSLRTSYGYMIHNFNPKDETKLVFYIDEESQLGVEEGRNGKSLIMKSVEYYKNQTYISGKKMNGGTFQWANVHLDTKFIMINDVKADFKFQQLFDMITDDMEIEKKNVDKFVIPRNRAPKMGLSTNYILAGSGQSNEARQHVVEFGSYWNRASREQEKTSDKKHLGETLFDWDKDSDGWNKFYNFGFKCVQEYLKKRLVKSVSSSYQLKSLIAKVEGKGGDGQGTNWLINWVKKDRFVLGENRAVSEDKLYDDFTLDNLNLIPQTKGKWDYKFFSNALWTLVNEMPDWNYNEHRSHKGNRKSDRRYQVGERDNQQPFIWITTKFDKKWNPTKKVTTQADMLKPIDALEDAFTPSNDVNLALSTKDWVIDEGSDEKSKNAHHFYDKDGEMCFGFEEQVE